MLHNWRETDRISEHQYTSMSEKIASYSNEPNNWEYQNTTMIETEKIYYIYQSIPKLTLIRN